MNVQSHFMDGFTSTWMRDVEQQLSPRESSPGSTKKLVDGACTDPSSPEKQGIGIEVDGELVLDGGEDESGGREFTCVSHGSISVMGRRRAMEDAVTVTVVPASAEPRESGSYDFFAVYDGHGGSNVADLCRDRLHELLSSEMEACGGRGGAEIDWNKVMAACFEKMDEEVGRIGCRQEDGADSEATVGSTAVVVVVGREEIVVANCGDSRAVLCRGGGAAVPLSRDHKPDRPDERERVEAAGGRVVNWRGSRVLGVLATSRSIGDHYLKPYVTSEPEVTVRKRAESDNFLVIASDGLWDVVSNEMACLVVSRCLDGRIRWSSDKEPGTSRAGMAAEVLAKLAMARDSKDNISVIVVELIKPGYDNSSTHF